MSFDLEAANREAKQRLVPALGGHGAHLSLDDAVRDFPARLYNEQPPHVPYSFWHQLEHIRIAGWDLWRYVVDPDHVSPSWPDNYWPAPNEKADADRWQQSIDRIKADRRAFVELIQAPQTNVLEPIEHMDGRSIMRAALLVIDHTAYHLGEFVMGRQILGAWESSLR
jgi:hypothetical protein